MRQAVSMVTAAALREYGANHPDRPGSADAGDGRRAPTEVADMRRGPIEAAGDRSTPTGAADDVVVFSVDDDDERVDSRAADASMDATATGGSDLGGHET